jgi:hypothetical protein
MALAWLTPLLLIVGLKIENWSVVYKAILFMFGLMIIAFLFFILGIKHPSEEWNWLFRPINFILLTAFYRYNLINKSKILLLIILYGIIAIVTEFRFEFIYLGLVILFITIDKISYVKIKKSFYKYILLSFVLILFFIFTIGYETLSNFISLIIKFQDSRSFLFNELFTELGKTSDLWFGRGSLGMYYSDFFERTRRYWEIMGRVGWAGDVPLRNTIEVGYLQMILKGGYVLMFLYSSLAFYASYLGLFKSKNNFTKRLGAYIAIILILSIISLRPAFTPTFIIFWMSIGTVLSKKHRNMTNHEIDNLIKFK